jgi:hypothetical protein
MQSGKSAESKSRLYISTHFISEEFNHETRMATDGGASGVGDFVGGNVVAEFGILHGILCVPGQIFSGKLPLNEFGILGEKKNAALQANLIVPFLDFAFK